MDEQHVTRLEYGEKEIVLVATAHVSPQSAELVKEVVAAEQPDSVCIELDEERYRNLQNPKSWERTDIVQVIKSKRVGFLLVNLALSSYQKKMAKKMDSPVGGEMLQGVRSAEESGAKLVLADRDIQTTFLRIWRSLSLWEKLKLFFGLVFSFGDDEEISDEKLEELMQGDMLESALAGIDRDYPKVGEILIHERDQYLACKIREAPGPKVVAVLGGAHVPGVREEIFREQDLDKLSFIPPKRNYAKVIGWIIPAIIVALIMASFAMNVQTGLKQITSWVVWNSVLAGAFTLIATGHPLSVLTAFVTAPFTSLNPLVACGWFAGLVQAWIKKPTVQDVQRIPEDIFRVRGLFQNRFLKVVMVVIFANIGSSIGTLAAGSDIIRNLFA